MKIRKPRIQESKSNDQSITVKELFYESSMRIPLEWIDSEARYSGVGATFSAKIDLGEGADTEEAVKKLTEFVHQTLEEKLKEQVAKALGIMKNK